MTHFFLCHFYYKTTTTNSFLRRQRCCADGKQTETHPVKSVKLQVANGKPSLDLSANCFQRLIVVVHASRCEKKRIAQEIISSSSWRNRWCEVRAGLGVRDVVNTITRVKLDNACQLMPWHHTSLTLGFANTILSWHMMSYAIFDGLVAPPCGRSGGGAQGNCE